MSVREIAQQVSGKVIGKADVLITGLEQIGQSCISIAAVAIGGSGTIGDFTTIGGEFAISDHVTIGSHVTIGGGSIVINDVYSHQFFSGHPAAPHKTTLQQWAYIKKLPGIVKKINSFMGPKA